MHRMYITRLLGVAPPSISQSACIPKGWDMESSCSFQVIFHYLFIFFAASVSSEGPVVVFSFLRVHLYSYLTLSVMPPFLAGEDKWVLERRHLNEQSAVTKAPACLFTSISLWFSRSQRVAQSQMIKEKWGRKWVCLTFLISRGSKSKFRFFSFFFFLCSKFFLQKTPRAAQPDRRKMIWRSWAEALDGKR